MLTRYLAAGILLTLLDTPVVGDKKECSSQDARSAEEGADRLRSWSDLHQAFKRFGQCDDGSIAELWSEMVVETLANQWATLPQLNALVSANPAFGDFVIRHIDETARWTSAQIAERNAASRCPKHAGVLCSRIAKRVDELRRDGEQKR